MNKMIVMVGVPYSGKSTIVDKVKDDNTFIYSTDIFLELNAKKNGTSYEHEFKNNFKEAEQAAKNALNDAIASGKNIIFDQTNMTKKKRKSLLNFSNWDGYQKECYYIRPFDANNGSHGRILTKRMETRTRNVPLHVVRNMTKNFQMPTIDEGFDEVTEFDFWGNKIGWDSLEK